MICGLKGVSLAKHLTGTHGITKEAYASTYNGQIKCTRTTERYSTQNKVNCDWIRRRKAAGDDLVEYRVKMGAAVSKSILSDPEERLRRSEMMAQNNRTQDARIRSSRVARLTSQREDIIATRTKNLAKWREEHPEEFYEKCIHQMMKRGAHTSKPQKELHRILSALMPLADFRLEVRKKFDGFTSTNSRRRYIDICSETLKLAVEYDGPHHFEKRFEDQDFEETQEKDVELDRVLVAEGYCLVRVSYDQWQKNRFKGECIGRLYDIITSPTTAVYRIGSAYNDVSQR